jgi:hypothetical protein
VGTSAKSATRAEWHSLLAHKRHPRRRVLPVTGLPFCAPEALSSMLPLQTATASS